MCQVFLFVGLILTKKNVKMIKFRPAVKRLPVYVPGVSDQSREGVLKLSSNENSYGCSSTITEIFKKEDFFQYPDATSDSLKKKNSKTA